MKKKLIFIILCLLIHGFGFSQKFAFKQITTEEGLSHDFVNDIIQSKDGYIWVATRDGVSKFNGKSFENLDKSIGLNSENINTLYEDVLGRLWIGSSDKGAYYLENGTITSLEGIHKPEYYVVNDFLEAEDGTIYIVCNNGIITFNEGLKKIIPLKSKGENSIKPLQASWIDNNTIYITTADTGILVFNIAEEKISFINNETHGISNETYSIFKDENDIIWVGTDGEFLKMKNQHIVDRFRFNPKLVNVNSVSDIKNKNSTELLLSFHGNGFAVFNKINGECEFITIKNGLHHRFINAIIEDNEENIWLGTEGAGLVKFRDKGFKLFDESDGLLSRNVLSMTATKNKTYVATALGVNSIANHKVLDTIYDFGSAAFIKAYDDKNVMFSNFSSIVEFSEDEKLKFSPEEKGLFTYLHKNESATLIFNFYETQLRVIEKDTTYIFDKSDFFQPIPYIRDLIEIGDKFIYMTRNGVFEINHGAINKISFGYNQIDVRAIDNINDSSFLVGDSKAIHIIEHINSTYDIKTIPIEKFNLTDEYVTFQLMDNQLWIGGIDYLKKIDLNQLIEHDTIIEKNIKIDKNLFGGIKRVGNLGVSNLVPTHDGQLMGKASNGLYMFNESAYKFHDIPPQINLKKIELFAEELNDSIFKNSTGEIVLPYDSNYLTFHPEAISFTYPEDVQFKYRLKGLREGNSWSKATQENKIVFSYLPPGDYVFEFTADNGNGVWQEQSFSYPFKIKSPFWRLPWFWIMTIIGFSGIVLFQIKRKSKLKEMQAQQFSQDLIAAQEEERTRISKDLHDSVGQQLTLIKKKAQNYKQEELSALTNQALDEVRSISRALYPSNLKQLGLTESIEQLLYDIDEQTELFVSVDIDPINKLFDEEKSLNIYRFIQEAINNVIKHANAKSLEVVIEHKNQDVKLFIIDNGKGFDNIVALRNKSLGLKTMAERIRILGGEFNILSALNKGTTIEVTIPV